MAQVHGYDPDDPAPLSMICGPRNESLPYWQYFEEDAQVAIPIAFNAGLEAAAKVAEQPVKYIQITSLIGSAQEDESSIRYAQRYLAAAIRALATDGAAGIG